MLEVVEKLAVVCWQGLRPGEWARAGALGAGRGVGAADLAPRIWAADSGTWARAEVLGCGGATEPEAASPTPEPLVRR